MLIASMQCPLISHQNRPTVSRVNSERGRSIRFLAGEQNDRTGKTRRAVEGLVQSAQAMKLRSRPEIPNGVGRFCSLDASRGSEERLRFGGTAVD